MSVIITPGGPTGGGGGGGGIGGSSVIEKRLTAVGSVLSADVDLNNSGIINLSTNIISNADVNRLIIQFNSDSGETGYFNRRSINNGAYNNLTNIATIMGTSIDTADRAYAYISISKMYDGADTTFIAHFTYSAYDDLTSTEGVVRRIFSGDVNLTTVRIETDQVDGMAVGSCMYIR